MLPPLPITRRLIMDAREELELVQWDLLRRNPQLLLQLSLGSALDTQDRSIQLGSCFTGDTQRVRAACVGPHVREGDLLRRTLLQEQPFVRVEEEDGECAVQEPSIDIGHQVT